ncbi:MAG: DUF4166 domain-containing protein, partial [Rubrivivax sp.]
MERSPVEQWFGPRFEALHPLLQQLHRQGGTLRGRVDIGFGAALAGWLGARIARRMGLPLHGATDLTVRISHDGRRLRWARRFEGAGGTVEVVSWFEPRGSWPQGHWLEATGALRFELGVDVEEGAWHWRVLRARWRGIPLPVGLLPRSRAGKRIVDGAYVFEVEVTAPVLGPLVWYRGQLTPAASP